MTSAQPRRAFHITGWHVLASLVVFFGVTALVDTIMIVDAVHTFPGEVASSPYEDGLAYDSQLDQQRNQAALGWRIAAGLAGFEIALNATDAKGAPLDGLRFDARLERPATEQGRRSIRFREIAPGVYRAEVGPLSGAWDLRLSAFDYRNRRFDAERRLIAP